MCGFVSCYYRLQDCGLRKKLERRQKKRDCAHLCVNVNYLPSGSYPKREAEQLERLVTTRKNKKTHSKTLTSVYSGGCGGRYKYNSCWRISGTNFVKTKSWTKTAVWLVIITFDSQAIRRVLCVYIYICTLSSRERFTGYVVWTVFKKRCVNLLAIAV